MKKIIAADFKVKDQASEDTVIEGWANKSVVDRGNDIIMKDAWSLDNYGKNSIILYNHDKDKPIGKALAVQATEQGLYIQARISKSKDPFVSYVRDMVKEGILNSFSVGFDAKQEAVNPDGVNEIKSAELYEVSIVTLPMNQDSQFRLSSKDMKKMSYKEVKTKVLEEKGATLAAELTNKLPENDDWKAKAIELAKGTAEELSAILAGNLLPVPENWEKALTEVFKAQPAEGDDNETQEQEAAEGPEVAIVEIRIPKNIAATPEAAQAWAEQNGFAKDNPSEDGDYYVIPQEPDPIEGNTANLDLGDGVIAVVGMEAPPVAASAGQKDTKDAACKKCMSKYMAEGMSAGKKQDQAVAYAISQCKDVCPTQPTKSEKIEEPVVNSETSALDKSEQACETEQKQALAPNTPPTGGTSDIINGDDNPYLAQGKEAIDLLKALIVSVQQMSSVMNEMCQQQMAAPSAATPEAQMYEEAKKTLEKAKIKLKNLGVNL